MASLKTFLPLLVIGLGFSTALLVALRLPGAIEPGRTVLTFALGISSFAMAEGIYYLVKQAVKDALEELRREKDVAR